jgi:hypothetical protein
MGPKSRSFYSIREDLPRRDQNDRARIASQQFGLALDRREFLLLRAMLRRLDELSQNLRRQRILSPDSA